MKLQKEVISNQKQPSCKKGWGLQNSQGKKDVKSQVAAKNGCDGRLMAKFLITIILVNLVPNPSGGGNINSPESLLLKFLPLTYHHSYFLAATFDFTSFSPWLFWRLHPFYSLAVFD